MKNSFHPFEELSLKQIKPTFLEGKGPTLNRRT